jgi:hypothetical protein
MQHKDIYLYELTALYRDKTVNKRSLRFYDLVSSLILSGLNQPGKKFSIHVYETEVATMAQFSRSVFATLTIGAEEKRAFDKWFSSDDVTALSALTELLGAGFKVSCSWVVEQNAFCFTVIGTDATKKHKGVIMTSWSDDLEEVICMGAYKHFVMCNGDEWPVAGDGNRWG